MIPVSHALAVQPAYAAAMAAASMMQTPPDAPLDLSRSKRESAVSSGDAPLDLSTKSSKRKSSDSDDDVIVVGVQKRPSLNSMSRNGLAPQWRHSGGYVTHQSNIGYPSAHQNMVQRASHSAYAYGSSQARAAVGYTQSYYSQHRSSSSSDLRSRTETRTTVPPASPSLSPRSIQKQQATREMMTQSAVLQAQATRATGSSDTTPASTQALLTDQILRHRMQHQRLGAHSASATREPGETRSSHYSAMQQARSQQDLIRNMHYGMGRSSSYASISSPQSSSRTGSMSSLPSAHSSAPMQYQHIAYHSPRTYSATVTTSANLISSSVSKYGYSSQRMAAAGSYNSTISQSSSRTSQDTTSYPRPPSLEPGERPSSRHKASPLTAGSYSSESGRRSGSLTPTAYQSAQHMAAAYMPTQSVPLPSQVTSSTSQRNAIVRSSLAAQIAKRQSPALHGAFMRPSYLPTSPQHRYVPTETAKSPASPGSSSSQPTYPISYNKTSSYSQSPRTDLPYEGPGPCLNKPPSTPPGSIVAAPKPQSMSPMRESTPSQLYSPRTLHSMPYESHSNPPARHQSDSGSDKHFDVNSTIDLSSKPQPAPVVSTAEPDSLLPVRRTSVTSADYPCSVSAYSVTSTTISTTTVQSKAVSVMSVTSLPDGPRLYRNPDAPNRPPLQNEAAGAQMKFIPVANVNPIVQKSGRTLHPKKQVLYQSRLDDLKKDSPDAIHGDESRSSTEKPISPPLKQDTDTDGGSEDLKQRLEELHKVIREKEKVQEKPITVNRVTVETKKRRHSLSEGKLHTVPIKERFKVKKMYRMSYHKNDMTKEEIDIKSSVCENEAYSKMCDIKENKRIKRHVEAGHKIVDEKKVSEKKATRKRSADCRDKSSYNPDIDNDESTVEYEMPSPRESPVAEETLDFTEVLGVHDLPTGSTGNTGSTKTVVKRRRRRRPRDGFARKVTRRPNAKSRAKIKTEATDNKEGTTNVRPGRKRHASESSTKPVVSRKGGRYDDPAPSTRTINTRNQAAARPGLGRLSLYNKNASYERELRREEYRKFLLRIKRQNKRCHATESESEKLEDPAITPPVTKVDNELRKLRPRRIALDEGEEKPKRKINRGRQLHTARKKYTLRSTPPKRSYWRKRGFIPVSELRMAPLIDVPAEPLGPEAEIISEMKKLVVCKDIGETVMHKAARLGNKKIIQHILDTGMFEVDVRDNAGYTPLHESCVKGHLEVTKLLLARGADSNACALDGTGPLHDAVDHGHMEITRLLLAHGADIRNSTCTGRTPMKVAARRPAMKKLLLGFLQDLNGLTEDNSAPIPWSFPSSCQDIDPPMATGCDVFADVPPDEDLSEGDLLFDLCDEPHLPVYHLFMGPDIGYRNYHLLKDITMKLRMNVRDFTSVFPTIPVEEIGREDFDTQIEDSGMSALDIRLLRNMDMVQVVEVSDKLMSVLGITRVALKSETLSPLQPLVIPPCDLSEPEDHPLDVKPKMESLLDSPPQEKCVTSDGLPYTGGMFQLSPDHFRSHESLSQPSFPRLGTGSPTDETPQTPPLPPSYSPEHVHNIQPLDLGSQSATLPPGPSCHRISPSPMVSPRSCAPPDQDSKVILDLDSSRTFTPISPPYHDRLLSTCAPFSSHSESRSIFTPQAGYPSQSRSTNDTVVDSYDHRPTGGNMTHMLPCHTVGNYPGYSDPYNEIKLSEQHIPVSHSSYPPLPTAPAYPIPLSSSSRPYSLQPHNDSTNMVTNTTAVATSSNIGQPPMLVGKKLDSIISENLEGAADPRYPAPIGFRKVPKQPMCDPMPGSGQPKKERIVSRPVSRSDHGLMIAKSPVILSSENLGEDDEVAIDRVSTISGEIVNRVDKPKGGLSPTEGMFNPPLHTVTNSLHQSNASVNEPKLAGELFSNIINEHLIQESGTSTAELSKDLACSRNPTIAPPPLVDDRGTSSAVANVFTTNYHFNSPLGNETGTNVVNMPAEPTAVSSVGQSDTVTGPSLGESNKSCMGANMTESVKQAATYEACSTATGDHSMDHTTGVSQELRPQRLENEYQDPVVLQPEVPSLHPPEERNGLPERTVIAS